MYTSSLHQQVNQLVQKKKIDLAAVDNGFYTRFIANASAIQSLYNDIYSHHPNQQKCFAELLNSIVDAYSKRADTLKKKDLDKEKKGQWFLSNEITGMSLYVDRFCGNIKTLSEKLDYFKELGVNFLHLMPVMESPAGESDGGYAVSDFRKVDKRFGTLKDLEKLQSNMESEGMYLMLDIVLNHTSHRHEWAEKAKAGDKTFQDYYYMFNDRSVPDQFDASMPEIFPESSPGNFTYSADCNKWVMTVFHNYQWDLNYTNPAVFVAMLDTIFFYANLGVDLLRIDAPAFIWKQPGTTCQNLPQAHAILQLIKQCVQVAAPGMALLGEAIVAPREIMKYFGTGIFTARECDFAYNATQMAVQWDALATGDTKVMLAAQHELLKKPYGATWITYTRCHDDIGLGYDDYMIEQAGFNAYQHRKFLKEFYSGVADGSTATGALFSVNPKTQDARISGSLASLCGLEKAITANDTAAVTTAINRIILMQAQSFFIGGVPMLFYGDEAGYTNDYSYLDDPAKSYDNRWMHRPVIDWKKHENIAVADTIEKRVFTATQKLINIRKKLPVLSDFRNLTWLPAHNNHVAGFIRSASNSRLYCLFNFSHQPAFITWYIFREQGDAPTRLFDHWSGDYFMPAAEHDYLELPAYGFRILEVV